MTNYAISDMNGSFLVIDADTGTTIEGGPYRNADSAKRRIRVLKQRDEAAGAAGMLVSHDSGADIVVLDPQMIAAVADATVLNESHVRIVDDGQSVSVFSLDPQGEAVATDVTAPSSFCNTFEVAIMGQSRSVFGSPDAMMHSLNLPPIEMGRGKIDIFAELNHAALKLNMSSPYGKTKRIPHRSDPAPRKVKHVGVYPQGRHFRKGDQYGRA